MVSGSFAGVDGDNNSDLSRDSIVDLLEAKGISWKAYEEAYPGKPRQENMIISLEHSKCWMCRQLLH